MDSVPQTSPQTIFREQSDKYSKSTGRIRSDEISNATSMIAVCAVGFVAIWYFPVLFSLAVGLVWKPFTEFSHYAIGLAPNIYGALWVVAVLVFRALAVVWAAWSLFALARALVTPTRSLRCPKCGVANRVYATVDRLICPSCRILLMLEVRSDRPVKLVPCPYCGLQTGVAAGASEFLCPNCGVSRNAHGLSAPNDETHCKACGLVVPQNAIFCTRCGTILQIVMRENRTISQKSWSKKFPLTDSYLRGSLREIYDMDWQCGKDAHGHFYFGKAIVTSIQMQMRGATSLGDIDLFLRDLALALISFEEAAAATAEVRIVAAYAQDVDDIYIRLLWAALSILRAGEPGTKLPSDALPNFVEQTYLKPRRRLEEKLRAIGSEVLEWSERILVISDVEHETILKGKERFRTIRSFSGLERDIVAYAVREARASAVPGLGSPIEKGAPSIISAANTTVSIGVHSTFAIISTGTPAPYVSQSGALPMGIVFVSGLDGKGVLGGSPVGPEGLYAITFKAANPFGSSSQTFRLKVIQAIPSPTQTMLCSQSTPRPN